MREFRSYGSVGEAPGNRCFYPEYSSHSENFPSEPLNGAVWGLWSMLFAIAVFVISQKFSLLQTTLLSWFVAFVLMWVVIWNMNVLPQELLYIAAPLSLFETFLATWIIKKLSINNVINK